MANPEENFLPNLVRYAAEKVKDSETFLRLQSICVDFNDQNGARYNPMVLVKDFFNHLQSGTLDYITIEQRLQVHYVLEVPVPEQMRNQPSKFDENGRLLEFSGQLQLGEPNFTRIFTFLTVKSWHYNRETQKYLEWRKEKKVIGPIGEGYLVQKFEEVRHILQDTDTLSAEDKVRIIIWLGEPLISEGLERSITNFGKIELEGRKIVAYIPNFLPEHLSICKTYEATSEPCVDQPPAELNPPRLQHQHENVNFNAQGPVSPVLPSPSLHGSDHDEAAGNVSIARHMSPPLQNQCTNLVSRKFLLERLELAIYTAGISENTDKLAKVVAGDISMLNKEEMVLKEDAEQLLVKALEALCRETPNNVRFNINNIRLDRSRMALARMVQALDNFIIHDEHYEFPSFFTVVQNVRGTDGYGTRSILKDNAYDTFLNLFKVWKNPNI